MNLSGRPKIVLLGMMTKMPVAGVVWQTIHYLVGLQRLGFDVYYAEDHGMNPSMFTETEDDNGSAKAAAFIARMMERFDLGARWSFHAWHDERYYGVSKSELDRLFGSAAAVINLHGGTMPRAEYKRGGPFIFIGTDPVALEVELHEKTRSTEEFLDAHDAFFTFGENIGSADCGLPAPPARYNFHPTRQPVILDFWHPHRTGAGERFTTIGNWQQPWRDVTFNGEVYRWSKHYEFLKFIDLPRETSAELELALSSYEPRDREMLEAKGWHVRHALDISVDIDEYRHYIGSSRGEWTVAKDQNIRLRSGWFSDRSATYLAAGRPVITQETGFSNVLPTGEGLFGFSTQEEILAAIDAINADYQRHARGAYHVACERFSYDVVLPELLEQSGVSRPQQTSVKRPALQVAKPQIEGPEHAPVPLEVAPQIPLVDGINVIAYLRTESGVGAAARSYVRALQMLNTPLSMRDVSDLCGNRAEDSSLSLNGAEEAYGVNLVCVDIDKHFGVLARYGEEFFNGRYNVAVWAWETQEFPKKWFDRFAYYDEIWVGTSFIADYLAPISPVPVLRVPPALTAPEIGSRAAGRQRLGVDDDEFVFLFIFDGNSTFRRKNPLAIVEAFRKAFTAGERARLVFKCVNATNYPEDFAVLQRRAEGLPISIFNGYWPAHEVRDLMAACDAYVSLHRSEGTGLTIADAMANGKPVIATGWSGNMDFMTQANSYPVRHEMMAIEADSSGPYRDASGSWAEVSLAHAAEMMRHVYEQRAEAAERGRIAREDLARNFSVEKTADIIRQRLRAIALRRRFSEFQTAMKQRYSTYVQAIRRIREIVAQKLPAGAHIAVISRGDEQLLRLGEVEVEHFPRMSDGTYAGAHPADSSAAIKQLEAARSKGADYLLVPNTMSWWFQSYPQFHQHLEQRYRTLLTDDACVIFDLRSNRTSATLVPRQGRRLALIDNIAALRNRQAESRARAADLVETLRAHTAARDRALGELEAKVQRASAVVTAAPVVTPPPVVTVPPLQKKREDYLRATEQIRSAVRRTIPLDAVLAVVTRGDAALLNFEGRRAWHFPRTVDGWWAGHHPADSDAAIGHLEELREKGLQYFVLPAIYMWWLDHYTGFATHLQSRYQMVLRDEFCLIHDVRESRVPARFPEPAEQTAARLKRESYQALVERLRLFVRENLPYEATLAIVSKGDPELVNFDRQRAWHFPRTQSGEYAGQHPADSSTAIAALEEMRREGLQYLLIPEPYFWWFNFYTDFARHLAAEFKLMHRTPDLVVYKVDRSASDTRKMTQIEAAIAANVPIGVLIVAIADPQAQIRSVEGHTVLRCSGRGEEAVRLMEELHNDGRQFAVITTDSADTVVEEFVRRRCTPVHRDENCEIFRARIGRQHLFGPGRAAFNRR